jgi:hypothetical protein
LRSYLTDNSKARSPRPPAISVKSELLIFQKICYSSFVIWGAHSIALVVRASRINILATGASYNELYRSDLQNS